MITMGKICGNSLDEEFFLKTTLLFLIPYWIPPFLPCKGNILKRYLCRLPVKEWIVSQRKIER